MTDDELKNLIQKEISDAKLDVSEKRFRTLVIIAGSFLTIFGVLFPIFITSSSSNRVDNAIEEMKSDVNYLNESNEKRIGEIETEIKGDVKDLKDDVRELITDQKNYLNETDNKFDNKISEFEGKFNIITKDALRKPQLECTIESQVIDGKEFFLDHSKRFLILKVENVGNALAKNIQFILYLKSKFEINASGDFYRKFIDPELKVYNDYIDYTECLLQENFFVLDAGQIKTIKLGIEFENNQSKKDMVQVKLKLYYEQPEKIEYNFKVFVDYD